MTARIDKINCILIVLACVFAIASPFGLLVLAYAVLGPLHYLTELCWLDERNYFLPNKRQSRWLIGSALAGMVASVLTLSCIRSEDPNTRDLAFHTQQLAITASLVAAALPLIVWRWSNHGVHCLVVCATILIGGTWYYLVDAYGYYLLLAVLLPTVLHVYVFTAAFLFSGAIKSHSIWGHVSFALLITCGAVFLLIDVPGWLRWDSIWVDAYKQTLGHVHELFARQLGNAGTDPTGIETELVSELGLRISRFLAFAYMYHYLNWFSKTSLIGWHKMPRDRLSKVILMWLGCVALYALNYSLGLVVVGVLSLCHVYCELPLNWRSFQSIAIGLLSPTRITQHSTKSRVTFTVGTSHLG